LEGTNLNATRFGDIMTMIDKAFRNASLAMHF
jgi:hypothetical protein